jgi:hypothetical protein
MSSRRTMVVVEDFYRDPLAVRQYALGQSYYTPYEDQDAVVAGRVAATWWATRFRYGEACPFKSSTSLQAALERAVGEPIDLAHWLAPFEVDEDAKPCLAAEGTLQTCLWNCCFHVKPENGQRLGDGVHNHVTDQWNGVGVDGWAGIVYLTPDAPLQGGLHLWRNMKTDQRFDWMTPAENWELIDTLGNVFNRLILVRGDVPHSGAGGWGTRLEEGRLYQTFFFRTAARHHDPVGISAVDD